MKAPILLCQSSTGNVTTQVTYIDESFWLTQKAMAQLFNVELNTINYLL